MPHVQLIDIEPPEFSDRPRMMPSLKKMHHGQHGDDCFACKLQSLHFSDGTNQKHQHNGNPWDRNPVVERIQELTGNVIDTDSFHKASRTGESTSQVFDLKE